MFLEPKTKQNLLELYKSFHYNELDRREKLLSKTPILIALHSLLVGVLATYIASLPKWSTSLDVASVYALLSLSAFGLLCSFIFAARFLIGHKYGYLPSSREISGYCDLLVEYNKAVSGNLRKEIDSELLTLLSSQYVEASTYNFDDNNRRSAYFHYAVVGALCVVVLELLAAVPYFYARQGDVERARKVEIVNLKEILDMATKPNSTNNTNVNSSGRAGSGGQSGSTPAGSSTPVPPQPPQVHYIKDGQRSVQQKQGGKK